MFFLPWEPIKTESSRECIPDGLRELGFSEAFLRALVRRGVRSVADAEALLHPERQRLPDPSVLHDMDTAVRLIREAVREGKSICVYGDYDVDGVCATTVMYQTLALIGADVSYYIPSRSEDGYGLNAERIRSLAKKGIQLLITVDNGISAHAEVETANSLGVDVIITDHHLCHETLPEAKAVVCATRSGQDERAASLCGTGVALMLAVALGQPAERFLAVAALATVADVMPLTGFNRVIVAKGIPLIQREPGLMTLLETAGLADKPVTETTLSFLLAPRLNAAGRMGDAGRSVELLLAGDEQDRVHYAEELEEANNARKAEEQRILSEAEAQIDPSGRYSILMLRGEDWNPGVIGIVASRIMEQHGCPVLLFTRRGEYLVGSGRSVPEVDLFGLLSEHAECFVKFGGHKLAGGATLRADRFEACREALDLTLRRRYRGELRRPPLLYEDQLAVSECTERLCEELKALAPFGEDNPEPVFLLQGDLFNVAPMSRSSAHLTASVSDGKQILRLVGFRMGERWRTLGMLKRAQVLCSLKLNTFRDVTAVNGYIREIRALLPDGLRSAAERFLFEPDEDGARGVAQVSSLRPDEREMRVIFSRYRVALQGGLLLDDLDEQSLLTMLVLYESGIVSAAGSMLYEQRVENRKDITAGCLYSLLHP